jgi:hypothetical protein
MRKWMLNLHLYGGLFCAPYLIIFGFSSLHFHYHFGFVGPKTDAPPQVWTAPLSVKPQKDNDTLATSVRDSLGLMGWTIPWNMKRDAAGDLRFDLERPGKSYTLHTDFGKQNVTVEERHKGFWQVVNSLHALGAVPNSKFAAWWGGYTEFCTAFVLFAAISGIYLWVNSKRERRAGWLALAGGFLFSIGLMVAVLRWG